MSASSQIITHPWLRNPNLRSKGIRRKSEVINNFLQSLRYIHNKSNKIYNNSIVYYNICCIFALWDMRTKLTHPNKLGKDKK